MPRLYNQRHLVLAGILLLGLGRGLLYALVVPPWQHPDEPTHFEHARYIAELGRLPAWADVNLPIRRAIAESMVRHYFWGESQPPLDEVALSTPGISLIGISTTAHPRLYYILGALWLKPWLAFSVETQLYALRLLSVALNLVALGLMYATTRELFPEHFWLTLCACAFLIFQPMYTDIMSAVNNDVLINTLGCGLFWVLASIYRRGWSLGRVILAGGLLIGALLTKTTAVALLAAFALSLFVYPWPGRARTGVLIGIGVLSLGGLGVVLAFGVLGRSSPASAWLITFMERYFRVHWDGTLSALFNPQTLQHYISTAIVVFRSFWAAFGWRQILLAPIWYWVPGLAIGLALFGLARTWVVERQRFLAWQVRYTWLALGAVLVAWTITMLRSLADQGDTMRVYLSHGRYAFVAIAPFAILFSAGIMKGLPPARRGWSVGAYVLCLAAFDALCFWGVLVPYYYA